MYKNLLDSNLLSSNLLFSKFLFKFYLIDFQILLKVTIENLTIFKIIGTGN